MKSQVSKLDKYVVRGLECRPHQAVKLGSKFRATLGLENNLDCGRACCFHGEKAKEVLALNNVKQ